MSFKLLTVISLGALSALNAPANPILVFNFSFETLPVGGLPNGCGPSCFYSVANVSPIPGWTTTNPSNSGQFQPGTQAGNTTYFSALSDGNTSAFANPGSLTQTVAPTVQLGDVYTLQVDIGHRSDMPFAGAADLLINGVQYNAIGSVPAPGQWSTYTATYTGLPADVGMAITIELTASGAQGNFDNVQLSDSISTATPEPGTITILALGLLGLVARSRRRTSQHLI